MSQFRIKKKHGKYTKVPIRHSYPWRDALYNQVKYKRRFPNFRIPVYILDAAPDDYFLAWAITLAFVDDYHPISVTAAHVLSEGRGINFQLQGEPSEVIPVIKFITNAVNDNWSKIPGWIYNVTFSKYPLHVVDGIPVWDLCWA